MVSPSQCLGDSSVGPCMAVLSCPDEVFIRGLAEHPVIAALTTATYPVRPVFQPYRCCPRRVAAVYLPCLRRTDATCLLPHCNSVDGRWSPFISVRQQYSPIPRTTASGRHLVQIRSKFTTSTSAGRLIVRSPLPHRQLKRQAVTAVANVVSQQKNRVASPALPPSRSLLCCPPSWLRSTLPCSVFRGMIWQLQLGSPPVQTTVRVVRADCFSTTVTLGFRLTWQWIGTTAGDGRLKIVLSPPASFAVDASAAEAYG